MATDGTLLQGEVSDSATNPLLDGAHVERLLAGFLKALVTEQVTDLRREATAQSAPAPSPRDPAPQTARPQEISKDQPAEASAPRSALRFIRGGKEGRA
jgi:hypothetical protein